MTWWPIPVASGIEVDSLLPGEGFDRGVLRQVGWRLVLDIVIEDEDRLAGILHPRRTDGAELLHHRRGVVVGHDVPGSNREKIPGTQRPVPWPVGHVPLGDLLDHGLCHDKSFIGDGPELPVVVKTAPRGLHHGDRDDPILSVPVV